MKTYEVGYRVLPCKPFETPYVTVGSWSNLGEAQLAARQLQLDAPDFEIRVLEVRHA